jgi:hypothetical protein
MWAEPAGRETLAHPESQLPRALAASGLRAYDEEIVHCLVNSFLLRVVGRL